MIGYAWGYSPGAPVPSSKGVDFIIEHARKASPENKINIVSTGALTNIAAAILKDKSIAQNIRLYALNMKYNFQNKAWNKNSFNARNDLSALDLILNNADLELWVIPGNVSKKMVFNRKQTQNRLAQYNNDVYPEPSRWLVQFPAGLPPPQIYIGLGSGLSTIAIIASEALLSLLSPINF